MTGNDGLDGALTRLIGAQDLAAKYAVLVAEGEVLLAPQAEERLAALAPGLLDEIGLALHQSLLAHCREHGLDDGANVFANGLINAWLNDDDWGRKVTLLADWSDPLLREEVSEGLAAHIQEETPHRERVQWHLDLLKSCRALGVSEGTRQHGEAAGKTPPATPDQPDTPAKLLEELSRLSEEDLPESWPREAATIETLLSALPPSGGEELDLFRAHLANTLATTYSQLLDAGMVDPTQAKALLERAHALYDEALEIFHRHQRWVEVAQTATNKALLLQSEFEAGEAGAAPRAHALYDEALEIFRRHQRWVEVAKTATNKANLLLRAFEAGDVGAAPRAHALYDEALEIRRRHQRWVEVATTANNQANLLVREFEAGEAGAAQRAHALYDEALDIRRRHQRWIEVATTAQNQALLLQSEFEAGEAGAAPRAHALYDEALEIFRRHRRWVEVAKTANNQANLLVREFEAGEANAAQRAHALYDEALEIFRRQQRWVEVAKTATNKANLRLSEFKAGDVGAAQRAHALYDEAERLSPFDMGVLQNLTIRRNHANLLIRMEEWQTVVALVVSMQADVRHRLPTLGATADRHHLLAALRGVASLGCMAALARGDVDQAVAILENGRSIDLGARLREAEARLSPSQRADLDAARGALYTARTAYQVAWSADPNLYPGGAFDARVKEARRELDACNAAFETLRSSLDLNLETPPPPPRDLLQALGPDSVLVQFWIAPRGGGALILGPKTDGWHHVPLPSLTEDGLNALLGDWFAAYQEFRQDMAPFAEAVARFSPAIMRGCQDLWSLAMGPLHAALAAQGLLPANGAQRAPEVVICPPGRFSILPLHAAINPATGEAFLDDYAVRYAPSLAAVLTATDRAAGRALFDRALVAVTNPQDDLGVEHNPALPFFAPSQRIDLRGYRRLPEATEVATADRLIAEAQDRNPSCISFYGHGGWDISEAENSAIFLASPLDTAGKIPLDNWGRTQGVPFPTTAIRDLPLANCRLFILAGCETGMIDLNRAPDEFIGLPAAALEGGAAGALASLWPVSTLDTYALVQRTLEDIHQTNASPAQALRRAQLRLRDDPDVYVGVGQGMGPAAPGGPGQDDPTDRGRSPYTWAAFSLFGA
ncbi:CHAT domain-containing protein [Rhodospirillum sp. A1_3_36]|uniref:CHAT domain-containing protein n=1 Tax=Rhodospirillum sp. A1_3_36 TaxID=3391666 RepID=UPI0039A7158D